MQGVEKGAFVFFLFFLWRCHDSILREREASRKLRSFVINILRRGESHANAVDIFHRSNVGCRRVSARDLLDKFCRLQHGICFLSYTFRRHKEMSLTKYEFDFMDILGERRWTKAYQEIDCMN